MSRRKYSNQEFIQAVAESLSIAQVIKKLGLKPCGGNYRTFYTLVDELKLNISHFKGQGWNKGSRFGPKRPIEDYLSNKYPIQSFKLKIRLVKEGYFDYICYSCRLTQWQGKPIPLELEHKDGNHLNNQLNNLTLLCPNCHALTDTYCGKNISR